MDTFELNWWMFAARKLLLFGNASTFAIVLPIAVLIAIRRKSQDRERLQMKILDEIDKLK
jgi:hypothetical protein